MLKRLTPNLMVNNVNQTAAYYRDILGFEVVSTVPEKGPYDWAMVKRGEVAIMFQTVSSLTGAVNQLSGRAVGGSGTIYIDVDHVEKLYEELEEKVEIVSDLDTTFYGTNEFTIMDLNGYVLTFAGDA
ncbi:MAG: VOC family protein [Salibacteraceae bacterium]